MSRPITNMVGDAYTNSHAWEVLVALVEVDNRMAGHEGEKEGAGIVADAFEAAGLREIAIDEFDIDGWWRGDASLSVGGHTFDRDHEVIALPGTTGGEVEAGLVDLGHAVPGETEFDVDGKIVLVRTDVPDDHDRWVHRLEKYAAAASAGAVGVLLQNHVRGGLPPTGEIGWGRRPSRIPTVGVSYELGGRLARYAEEREPTVRLSVDCQNEASTSVNVEGVVGPDTDREVLVTAHVDAHDIAEGARDNGVGCALVAEIGRLLASIEDDLETRVRCVTFGSEEVGLLGAQRFVQTRDLDSIKCVINIDGAGKSRTPDIRTYEFEKMEAVFEEVAHDLDIPISTRGGLNPHTDAWPFAAAGVPAVTAGSEAEGSGRGWGHTHADTLDKLDSRDVRDLAIVFAKTAFELSRADYEIDHKSRRAIRELVADHTEAELSYFGRWPFRE